MPEPTPPPAAPPDTPSMLPPMTLEQLSSLISRAVDARLSAMTPPAPPAPVIAMPTTYATPPPAPPAPPAIDPAPDQLPNENLSDWIIRRHKLTEQTAAASQSPMSTTNPAQSFGLPSSPGIKAARSRGG